MLVNFSANSKNFETNCSFKSSNGEIIYRMLERQKETISKTIDNYSGKTEKQTKACNNIMAQVTNILNEAKEKLNSGQLENPEVANNFGKTMYHLKNRIIDVLA